MTLSESSGGRSASPALTPALATAIYGVVTVASTLRCDDRGSFARLFDGAELATVQRDRPIVQINRSVTTAVGAIRGLHFQTEPALEAKWVRCLRGRVLDVVVDLRCGSPTLLGHVAVELSAAAMNAIFVPEGCAHGFQVLEPESELLYLHTAAYDPDHEGGIRWDDPRLAIAWPLPALDLSVRDRAHPFLTPDFAGITI